MGVVVMEKKVLSLYITMSLCCAFISIALPSVLFAGEKPEEVEIEQMVVTATMSEIAMEDAPGAITIITAADIKDACYEDLLDAVRESTGIFLSGQSVGGRKSISIRGLDSRHSLILIDGRRIAASNAAMGHSDYENSWVPMEDIERIEIVRGPLSALYGSEAMGGVINIITKSISKKWGGSVEAGGGFRDDGRGGQNQKYSMLVRGPVVKERLGVSLSAEHIRNEDTLYKEDKEKTDLEGREIESIGGKLVFTPLDDHQFTLHFQGTQEERWRNAKSRRGSPYLGIYDLEKYMTGLDWNGKIGPANSSVKIYRSYIDKDVRNKYKNSDDTFSHDRVTDDVLNAHTSFLIMENLITLGGELRDETLKSPTIDKGEDDATHSAFFLQDEIELFDRLMLTLGVRWDHHEFFGSETSPRIYAVYKATDNLTFKAGYGQAFNAPTIKQVSAGYKAMTGPHTFFGNPDVDAETSDNYEVGAEYVTDRFHAKAFFFDNEIDDMIDWRKLDPACRYPDRCEYIADNIEEARTRGVETEIGVDLSYGFNISANYTYLDAKDTEKDERLEDRPRHSTSGKLKYVYEPWQLNANLRFDYVGSQIMNEEEVPVYTLWHFAVRKKILDNFELKLGVDNIGDERLADKSDAFDYEERGRFFYGSLRMFF